MRHTTKHSSATERKQQVADRCLRELVACIDSLNQLHPKSPRIELWDFRGFSSYHTEPLVDSDGQSRMKWFYEVTHCRPELGDIILDRMLGDTETAEDFGTLLTTSNVDQHLESFARAREQFSQENPNDLLVVELAARKLGAVIR